ncbi:GNAT family N-acetyltransferase [Insolitispirillum peregrinum]|uniref:L-amino acid N-acyltransferase YncA n=1 Tax=Insolitispirillum peregrinum TaxID=80876 RepID=A0A1N7IK08_9PROT|nr:GNAT family N-acetyltransferase [Insolitispirillum peregrinum]SIS37390.1 L-amino acid N-acyltransferase YncA [Insolitispirillum peregrinum]
MTAEPHHFLIRLATVEDADAIGLIHRTGQKQAAAESLPAAALAVSASQYAEEWRHWLRLQAMGQATGFVLVVDTRQGVGGFLCAVPPRPAQRNSWTIQHLYVLPAFQGQGIGQRLQQAAFARMRSAGAERVELLSFANNPSRHFYDRCGWREIAAETLSLYRTVLPMVRYQHDLTDWDITPDKEPSGPMADDEGLEEDHAPYPDGGVSAQDEDERRHGV